MIKVLVGSVLIGLMYFLYKEIKGKKEVFDKKEELEELKSESEVLDVEEDIALQKADNIKRKQILKEMKMSENENE